MSDDRDAVDGWHAVRRVPGRFYVSSRFPPKGIVPHGDRFARFAYQVFDAQEEVSFEDRNGWELSIRETATRQQLKALFFESSRQVEYLSFQRFNSDGKPIRRESFVLAAEQVRQLADFLSLIRSAALDIATEDGGARLLPEGIDALLSDESARMEVFERYRETFAELLAMDVDAPEIVAIARRKRQLEVYRRLLEDPDFLVAERHRLRTNNKIADVEKVWQQYFENNHWVFGGGLGVQFLHAWKPSKLEQTVVGASLFGPGKRPDAVLHTASALGALVLVEIKRHDTRLLAPTAYRSDVWRPTDELSGAVSQCQATVDLTLRYAQDVVSKTDTHGYETGKKVVLCRPRSVLVVGSLSEFFSDGRPNTAMFKSFERYRRSLSDPEIVTFDELHQRAKLVLSLESSRDEPGAGKNEDPDVVHQMEPAPPEEPPC